jgi:tetratricopeptide (TPR) repeat protein
MFGIGHSLLSSIAHTPQSSTLSPVDNYGLAKYMFEHIDRIEVITSSVIISKRREGHTEESLNALWSLTEKSGRAENWFRLTNIFMRCKRYDKAIEAARRATVGDPKNAQYHYHHGLMMEHGGDVSGASEAMRQVLKFTTEQSLMSAAQSHLDRLTKSLKGEA